MVRAIAREFAWGFDPGGSPDTEIYLTDLASGPQAALARYGEIKAANEKGREVGEGTLNMLGYSLLGDGRTKDAIAFFERNVAEYPKSANAYDSLGEAYMKDGREGFGDQELSEGAGAGPANKTAPEALKKLREMK